MVTRIVDAEGPIHVDEVARRVSAAFGKARTGGRIAPATLEALRHAGTAGQILRDDDFWMTDAQREDTPIRDRSAESRSILNVAALPGIEIRAAAKLLERESGRMESRTQVRAVARLLGFRQVRPDLQAAIQSALEEVPRDRCGVGFELPFPAGLTPNASFCRLRSRSARRRSRKDADSQRRFFREPRQLRPAPTRGRTARRRPLAPAALPASPTPPL